MPSQARFQCRDETSAAASLVLARSRTFLSSCIPTSFFRPTSLHDYLPLINHSKGKHQHHHQYRRRPSPSSLFAPTMATSNKRVPLSCEPCRERKIRCHRTSPGICRTCDTCLRRGIPLEECIFLRDLPRSQRPINRRLQRTSNANASQMTESQRLYARIEKLESYLKASNPAALDGATSTPRARHEDLSMLSTLPPTISPSPSIPNTDGQGRRSTSAATTGHQKIHRTASGHQTYEPFPSVFQSCLDGDDAEISRLDRSDSCRQFPFTTTTSSLGDLLSVLPPLRHCDALKDLYMRVFGSVSVFPVNT